MTSPRTWTVVSFESDNSVQAVPTKWLNGENCLWPVLPQDKLVRALKNCDYSSHWPAHKVRIFRNATYDDYAIARAKAAKAEYSSDLNSDDDTAKLGLKRSRTKRFVSSSDSEDEIEINFKKEKKQISCSLQTPPPPPPSWNEAKDDCGIIETPVGIKHGEKIIKNMKSRELVDPANITSDLVRRQHKLIKILESSTSGNCRCNPQVLYNIQSLLIEINSKVDRMAKSHSIIEPEPAENVLVRSKVTFPVTHLDSLNDLEQFLALDGNYKSLVAFFARMGGVNIYDFVKRCLGGMLSDTLAIKYSFMGRKGKKKFCDLQLSKALLESAEKSGLPKDRKETEIAIGCWLRKAKDRTTREQKKNENLVLRV